MRSSRSIQIAALSSLAWLAACGETPVREDQLEGAGESEDAVRACASGPTVQGIDVSHWQGRIDWGAVARSGKVFAITKATEGTTYVDDTFAPNWAGMRAAGIIRGAYHYFHPGRNPEAQADFFADTMGPLSPGDLPPMLDLEETDGQPPHVVADATRRFLARLEARTGRKAMIYTGYYFWRDQTGNPSDMTDHPLVMAAYVSGCPLVPDSWGSFTMWQYTSSGRVPGISGNVDLDVFNGDLDALRRLAAEEVAPPGPPPPAPTGCGIIGWDSGLSPGESVKSCSGRFTLVHQGDGNVVIYDGVRGDAAWNTGTNGHATDAFVMQGDGNLVLYARGGTPIWASGTNGHAGAYLAMQDDGNLVIYAPGGRPLWATNTVRNDQPPPPPPPPPPAPEPQPSSCGIAHGTTILGHDQGINSCNGRYWFVHQGDGNVVLYTNTGRALWSTRTNGRSTGHLVMQSDGNLVLYSPSGRALWASGTDRNPGAFLAVQDDGNVVVYRADGRPLWATGTNQ